MQNVNKENIFKSAVKMIFLAWYIPQALNIRIMDQIELQTVINVFFTLKALYAALQARSTSPAEAHST